MEIKDFVAHHAAHDEALREIAAKIRPLPLDIVPSAGFREQMRLRLLKLDFGIEKSAATQQAA